MSFRNETVRPTVMWWVGLINNGILWATHLEVLTADHHHLTTESLQDHANYCKWCGLLRFWDGLATTSRINTSLEDPGSPTHPVVLIPSLLCPVFAPAWSPLHALNPQLSLLHNHRLAPLLLLLPLGSRGRHQHLSIVTRWAWAVTTLGLA